MDTYVCEACKKKRNEKTAPLSGKEKEHLRGVLQQLIVSFLFEFIFVMFQFFYGAFLLVMFVSKIKQLTFFDFFCCFIYGSFFNHICSKNSFVIFNVLLKKINRIKQ